MCVCVCLFVHPSVPCCSDEPWCHPAPERQTAGGRGQLPARPGAEARRLHHPVQPAQAVEYHGETGPKDQGTMTLMHTHT